MADFVGHDAEQIERIRLAGMETEYLTVKGLGVRQAAGLVMLKCLVKSGTQWGHVFS